MVEKLECAQHHKNEDLDLKYQDTKTYTIRTVGKICQWP